eukprot:3841624-Amphidinium_carterae.1
MAGQLAQELSRLAVSTLGPSCGSWDPRQVGGFPFRKPPLSELGGLWEVKKASNWKSLVEDFHLLALLALLALRPPPRKKTSNWKSLKPSERRLKPSPQSFWTAQSATKGSTCCASKGLRGGLKFPLEALRLALDMNRGRRRILVNRAVCNPVVATSGIPAGCGLAVDLLHAFLQHQIHVSALKVSVRKYVDGMVLSAAGRSCAVELREAFRAVKKVLESAGMQLNKTKCVA